MDELHGHLSREELSDYMFERGAEEGERIPSGRALIDGVAMDREMAEDIPCEKCGGEMTYIPFRGIDDPHRYAAAVAYCDACQFAIEF